jgi:Tfp pilus assembly protein PilN
MRLVDKPPTADERIAVLEQRLQQLQQLSAQIERLEYRIADLEACNNSAIALIRERGGDG